MKQKTFVTVLLVLMLALSVLAGGCQGKNVPAATVGDREITVQQLKTSYLSGLDYASYSGYDTSTDEGKIAYRDYMLDSLIATSMKAYQAKLAGITLTADEQTEAENTAKKNYDDTFQSFVDKATSAGSSSPEAYAKTLFTNALVSNNTTVAKLKATMLEDAQNDTMIAKHKEMLLQGISLSEDELAQKYKDELAVQKEELAADPSKYFTYESYANYGYSAVPLYVPEGFFRVRQILVADEATAALIKQKLDAGEDFETLLKQYNTDPGMQDETNAAGYLVGKGASYVESFLNAALALAKDGDVSAPVQSDYGWHIIKRVSTEASREIPYAEVKDKLDAYEQLKYQNQYYSDIVAGWVADNTLVTKYPDNYASIGQN